MATATAQAQVQMQNQPNGPVPATAAPLPTSLANSTLPTGINGGAPAVVDFNEALSNAYITNATLGSARASVRATDENVPQAVSGWRPTVAVTGTTGAQQVYYDNNKTAGRKDAYTNPTSVGLTAAQPIWKYGIQPNIDSAEAQVLAARATLASTEQQVLLQAATAYLAVVRDQAVVDLNRNNEQVLRKQLEATQDRFRVGEVTRTDVSQAQAAWAGAIAGLETSEGVLVSSRATFEKVIGVPANKGLGKAPLPADLPTSEEQTWAIAQDEHPDILAARYREESSKSDIAAAAGGVLQNVPGGSVSNTGLLPSAQLVGTLQRGVETTLPNVNQNTAQVTVQVTVPLYESGYYYSAVRQKKQVNSQRKIQIDEAFRNTRANVTQAWEALLTARANIRSFSAQVEANRVALESIEQEAKVGSRTVLDVLITEQNLLSSSVSLVRSEYDERVAAYSVKAAMGRLTATNLKLPVEYYDPTENYKRVRNKWIGTDGGLK